MHHAAGGRRRDRALRLQSALDPGRRGRPPGARPRRPRLRHQGRGPRDLLRPHRPGARLRPAHDPGRRRRPGRRAAHDRPQPAGRPGPADPALGGGAVPGGAKGAGRRRAGVHRGDHHRRHPAQGDGQGGRAPVPDHRRERFEHQAHVRQPLRHRPVHAGRHRPGDQHAARRKHRGRRRLRLVRPRGREPGPGRGRPRDRDRGRSAAGAGGPDGWLRGACPWPRRRRSAISSSR